MWKIDERVGMNETDSIVTIDCGHSGKLDFAYVITLRSDDPEIRYFCCENCYHLVFGRMLKDARTITMKMRNIP